ncbi:YitT family protein [Mycoplasmopsis ciconiae]|uniref:YitT family protein n=1 Tax=Mycoplasmopsis ciconiae TaxID=561067 RepID=A0ABU7MKL4_9BACT|nr:YitT family protein [Mycoplasmopsis ciconiae]
MKKKTPKMIITESCCEKAKASKIQGFAVFKKDPSQNEHDPDCCNYQAKQDQIAREAMLINYKIGKYLINTETKMSFKQIIHLYWYKVILIILSAFVFNFAINVFLFHAHTIPSGLTGIPTLIILLNSNIKPYFALLYLAVNIPMFIIFGRKIKLQFTIMTAIFMFAQIGSNLIFTDKIVSSLHDFFNFAPGWDDANQGFNTWPSLLYGVIGASMTSIAVAISWKAGGSTGGTDFISYYYSTKTKKNISGIMTLVSLIGAVIFLVIYSILQPVTYTKIVDGKEESVRILFGMRELSTFMYIAVNGLIINLVYPKYAKVKVTISCSNPEKVLGYLKLINYWHGYQVITMNSGYSGQQIYRIETVMLLMETKSIIHDIKKVDPSVFITTFKVNSLFGNFNTAYVER